MGHEDATQSVTDVIRGVSLFTGAGGMDIGFEAAGVEVVFANEMVQSFADTWVANHPNPGVMHVGDIDSMLDELPGEGDAELVFGGPPCQAFSIAGKMDPNDPRAHLIFSFLDAVERVQPMAFVMENVRSLGELRKWDGVRKKWHERAEGLGYGCMQITLHAPDYGVPQKRDRTFFIGIKGDTGFVDRMTELIESRKCPAPTVREAIVNLGRAGSEINPATCPAKVTFARNPIMRSTPYAGMYFNGAGRPIDLDGYANTLPASMGGNRTPIIDEDWLHGNECFDWVAGYHRDLRGGMSPRQGNAPSWLRRLTVREAMRLQTFPDDYEFKGSVTSVYRQIGNAVPVKLAQVVAESLLAYLSERDGKSYMRCQEPDGAPDGDGDPESHQ